MLCSDRRSYPVCYRGELFPAQWQWRVSGLAYHGRSD